MMAIPSNPSLEMIDSVMLTPFVRESLQRGEAELLDWKIDRLYGGSFHSEIHRFSGRARDRDETLSWSLILKIIRSLDGHDDPAGLNYWTREALAYQSGLLDQLPDVICAPRCFGIVEPSGSDVWPWLEAIMDELSGSWSLDQYGNAARQLGLFNAAGLGKQAQLTQPWLTKGQLRAWVGNTAPEFSPKILEHPLVARVWPNDIYEWMLRVWSEHGAWLDRIEHQPQTLAHLDAFRRNLFSRRTKHGDLQTVMIDWAFAGSAAPGEEIAPLVAASLNFMDFDVTQAKVL